MELVSVLPSAEDEVNVACFHPLAGGGIVYGTKVGIWPYPIFFFPLLLLISTTILDMQHVDCIMQEGKLRVLQYDGAYDGNYTRPNFFLEENMVEVEQYSRLW